MFSSTGIFNSGTSIGVVLALIIVPWILRNYSWNEVLCITGAIGFIWLIFWLVFYNIPAKQKRLSSDEFNFILNGKESETKQDEINSHVKIKWHKLFTLPQTWALIAVVKLNELQ